MTDKYTVLMNLEDNLVGVNLLRNGIQCSFQDVVDDERCQFIILDLIAQAYVQGKDNDR